MKHLKIWDNYHDVPQIGDYVICQDEHTSSSPIDIRINEFTSSTIGKYVHHIKSEEIGESPWNSSYRFVVKFEDLPNDIIQSVSFRDSQQMNKTGLFNYSNGYYRGYSRNEITYFSSDRSELEIIIDAKKYNI